MGGAKLLKWRLAAEGAKLLKSGAALILSIPRCPRAELGGHALEERSAVVNLGQNVGQILV